MTSQPRTRQEQAYRLQEQSRYDRDPEGYMRRWALDVTRGMNGSPEDLQAVRDMPLNELRAWYKEWNS